MHLIFFFFSVLELPIQSTAASSNTNSSNSSNNVSVTNNEPPDLWFTHVLALSIPFAIYSCCCWVGIALVFIYKIDKQPEPTSVTFTEVILHIMSMIIQAWQYVGVAFLPSIKWANVDDPHFFWIPRFMCMFLDPMYAFNSSHTVGTDATFFSLITFITIGAFICRTCGGEEQNIFKKAFELISEIIFTTFSLACTLAILRPWRCLHSQDDGRNLRHAFTDTSYAASMPCWDDSGYVVLLVFSSIMTPVFFNMALFSNSQTSPIKFFTYKYVILRDCCNFFLTIVIIFCERNYGGFLLFSILLATTAKLVYGHSQFITTTQGREKGIDLLEHTFILLTMWSILMGALVVIFPAMASMWARLWMGGNIMLFFSSCCFRGGFCSRYVFYRRVAVDVN